LSCDLKADKSVDSCSSAGKEFQAAGPAKENARSPNLVRSRGVT